MEQLGYVKDYCVKLDKCRHYQISAYFGEKVFFYIIIIRLKVVDVKQNVIFVLYNKFYNRM